MSAMQKHIEESARAARAAHAEMMRAAREGRSLEMYLCFRPGHLGAFVDGPPPGWELGSGERIPGDRTANQLVAWFAQRTGRLPYMAEDAA